MPILIPLSQMLIATRIPLARRIPGTHLKRLIAHGCVDRAMRLRANYDLCVSVRRWALKKRGLGPKALIGREILCSQPVDGVKSFNNTIQEEYGKKDNPTKTLFREIRCV